MVMYEQLAGIVHINSCFCYRFLDILKPNLYTNSVWSISQTIFG